MKNLVLALFLCPFISNAQKLLPRFENDTLFTTSGFTISIGDTLHFATGTKNDGNFRFIRLKSANGNGFSLTNNSVVVTGLGDFAVSGLGNGYITIIGAITYKDGSKGKVNIHMAFDKAIEGFPGLPSELIVPEKFKHKQKFSVADEISKLYKLYQDGILTKEEFETQKKKLLDQ